VHDCTKVLTSSLTQTQSTPNCDALTSMQSTKFLNFGTLKLI